MDKKINIIILGLIVLTVFFGCESEETYDFDSIEPLIVDDISGNPGSAMMGRFYKFSVVDRTNSSYNWSCDGAEIVSVENYPASTVGIFFPDNSKDYIINVSETNLAGVTGDAKTDTVFAATMIPFATGDISGFDVVNQGFSYDYELGLFNDFDKDYSSFSWYVESSPKKALPTITQNTDEPWKCSVSFTDPGDYILSVIETGHGGDIDTSHLSITCYEYCPMETIDNFVGSWQGDDAWYPSWITTTAKTSTSVNISHIGQYFMEDWWGEPYQSDGTVEMLINEDGTITIDDQYMVTTIWDGDYYDYDIRNVVGRWNNCGNYAYVEFTYTLYNTTDGYALADYYGDFSAHITLDPAGLPKRINTNELKKVPDLKELKNSLKNK